MAKEGEKMTENQIIRTRTKENLVSSVEHLGFPTELGEVIAKHLGSPKAMERMVAYLDYVKPESELLHLFVKSSVAL